MGSYSDSLAALVTRLKGHRAKDCMLSEFNFAEYPQLEGEGQDTLPEIRLLCPLLDEQFRERDTLKTSTSLKLLVSTPRTLGVANLVQAVEKVMDAVERVPVTNALDPHLSATLRKPVSMKLEACVPSDLGLNAVVELTLYPVKIPLRGRRSV